MNNRSKARSRRSLRNRLRSQSESFPPGREHLGGKLFPGASFDGGLVVKFSDSQENRFTAFVPKDTPSSLLEEVVSNFLNDEWWSWDV